MLKKDKNELFVLAPNSVSGIHSADKVFLPFKICQEFLYLLRSTDFFAKKSAYLPHIRPPLSEYLKSVARIPFYLNRVCISFA